jgi:3-hydroxyacyl-CoA dehydrogenase
MAATKESGGVGAFTAHGEVGVLAIDSPPVNALGLPVRVALVEGLRSFLANDAIKAIVLICRGRTFFAGADITEIGQELREPSLQVAIDLIEGGGKPVIAAIHGTALGGGYEMALVCHHRIAVPSARFGLPEVNLGLLPGAGGTQRLPRIVGIKTALDLILSGRQVAAPEACELGMVDALAGEKTLEEDAIAFARRILAEGKPLVRVRDRQDKLDQDRPNAAALFADARKNNAIRYRGQKAPENIVKAVEASLALPFDQGIARELELFFEIQDGVESLAQRYAFFAERETAKIPDIPRTVQAKEIAKVGVIGAGTMGGGITMNFLNVGIPVTLVDMSQAALDRGIGVIRKNYEATAAKGRLTKEQVEKRMALITPAIELSALGDADLIIEAVFEEMAIKRDVFAKLDVIAKPGAVLASNTSFLDLNEIAAATKRPDSVIGLHFFSPANVMRLLEVVRGAKTSPEIVATAMALAKRIAKTPVLSGVGPGFIANRIMTPRSKQADQVILEGVAPQDVDKVIYDYGFAMGPFQVIDLVGLDVIGREETEANVRSELVARGRLGQKQGGGYYDYDEKRRATPSPIAAEIIAAFARSKNAPNKGAQSSDEILARLLYPVVNEGARILEEGIALRASDIDVACILGYNWPIYTGGPMFWADTVGLPKIVAKLEELEREHGAEFTPSALLRKKAANGESFTR